MALTMQLYNTYLCPATDALLDLGASAKEWKDLYMDGVAYIDGFGEDTDMGDFDIHSIDGLYGFDDDVYIDMGADGRIIIQANGAGTPFSTPDIDITGSVYFDDDIGLVLDKKLLFGDTAVAIFSDDDGYLDLVADTGVRTSNFIRHTSANYRRYYHLAMAAFDPGASGATWVDPDGSTMGGWQLDAAGEVLFAPVDLHADWDGVSDIDLELYFEINTASTENDTVDIKVVFYYKAEGSEVMRTQTVEVATNVGIGGIKAQYTMFKVEIPINWDELDNVILAGDQIMCCINLETDTSEVDNIILTGASFYYHTTHLGIESGDT